ncbi:hypothetical protein JET14_13470 [Martelella lutilitoris]|uniref:Uncharacterized protein n=1 Tax=Martelella lutilitoris TaxID=2583532 RepID=A0A7T7HHJ7_9HYPH|nr:hypothetical protein [Martelella lutilitoris]QQM29333.1 hypothetical protein JET14_13470 [Martelella lutilitoris]
MSLIQDIKQDRENGTPPSAGNWFWDGGRDMLALVTKSAGRRYVMDFVRKGMKSAQPRFQIAGIMYGAIDHLTQYEVGDGIARGQKSADDDASVYRMDIKGVDHPDARRLARVPEMEAAILEMHEALKLQEELSQIGLLQAPVGFIDKVTAARRAILAKIEGTGDAS